MRVTMRKNEPGLAQSGPDDAFNPTLTNAFSLQNVKSPPSELPSAPLPAAPGANF
jgi:hypothetical protein